MKKYKNQQRALSKEQSKIRVLAIERMLGSQKPLSISAIQKRLDLQYDIHAERKTIMSDIYAIDRFCPIEITYGRYGGYRKANILGGGRRWIVIV